MGPARTSVRGTTIGTTGSPWRAVVTPGGTVVPADGSPPLAWWIAADDRWHDPEHEPTTRQRLVEGTPVVETAVRVPSGDALHRVYAVAGGATVIEVENQSPLPFAVAFSHDRLCCSRPRSPLPPGAPGAVAFGVAHRTTLRLVLAHDGTTGPLPNGLPSAEQVARGWRLLVDRRPLLSVPDETAALALVTARCAAALAPLGDDPVAACLVAGQRVRVGDPAKELVDDVAPAAVAVARAARRRPTAAAAAALDAALEVLARADEARGTSDVLALGERVRAALGRDGAAPAMPPAADGPTAWLAWERHRAVAPTGEGADLFPGYPPAWYGHSVELTEAVVPAGTVSVAIRWHGARPALLWDASAPMRLTCAGLDPAWSTTQRRGEALLAAPPPP